MPAPKQSSSTVELASSVEQKWLGHSLWQAPKIEISRIKSWPSLTAMSFYRDPGEAIWRGDRPVLVLAPDGFPRRFVQIEQGPTWQEPRNAPGSLAFRPAGVTVRVVQSAMRLSQVIWDPDLHAALLPELGIAASRFEPVCPLRDPLLSQIVKTLTHEIEAGFADRILVESLGTALCIRIARHFVGRLPLSTNRGLSPARLQRVCDYVEAHLDDDLSLTVLAEVACLSPYHFSRSFKQATGLTLHHYVVQRRVERAKTLMHCTQRPLGLIAQEAGFTDQSHLTSVFRRELGVTPGRFRAALA
jgi:AraC family transcriptional regulator